MRGWLVINTALCATATVLYVVDPFWPYAVAAVAAGAGIVISAWLDSLEDE